MKTELNKDLSVLTTINESTLERLNKKVLWCINDCVEKSIKDKTNLAEINLGYGTLLINFDNKEVKFRFVPSKELERSVSDTIVTENNELINEIEESLVSKITNLYKDFF